MVKRLALVTLITWLAVSACSWRRTYHATPSEALTEFPGYLTEDNLDSALILQEETVANGVILLYLYPSDGAGLTPAANCLATTFVTQERNGSWRPQSASRMACGEEFLAREVFTATYTVGGNVTDLTTAYGLSTRGEKISIEWSDGKVSLVPVVNGSFLSSRPETLRVKQVSLLKSDGTLLERIQLDD